MVKNREKRKEVAKVFFTLSTYLLTTVGVSSVFLKESINIGDLVAALVLSVLAMLAAYYIYPPDKEK